METTNGDSRAKRKHPPTSSTSERPLKQLRPHSDLDYTNGASPKGSDSLNGASDMGDMDFEDEEGHALSRAATGATETAEWQATIEKVIKSAVSIHFCQTCSFDTDPALSSEATGFVVDAERGYILTNRHVVGAGPFWGYCLFENHEECDVWPVYRDPIHDFGLLRFDPKAIKYMQVQGLDLRPEQARVGAEIRVVGNDAGEKLSILSGVISRLDRNAPEYGEGYSDFNTNYIQASASASGGSSGSPVVNLKGVAVALQAGGRADGASTDYFLPLDRPKRALECLQRGKPVTRGTIQTQWLLKPFDECRRLGLTPDREAELRDAFPKETCMLVAESVLPAGPADNHLEEGDLLIRVNGELLTQFIRLDEILDTSVGKPIELVIQRGGEILTTSIVVEDLHAITPDRFVSVAGASFHDLSYQQARLYAISTKGQGVFVCDAAGSFRFDGSGSGWLVQGIDNRETPDLNTFVEVMNSVPDRARVTVNYKHLRDLHTMNTSIIMIDRHWSRNMRLAVRNDKTGLWDFSDIGKPIPAIRPPPTKAKFQDMSNPKFPKAMEINRSFVRVSATMPIRLDGFPRSRKSGHGLVLNAEKGLVIIARSTVPYDLCDLSLTFANNIIVDGKVVFLHPLQNYAIIQYDPSLVLADVQSAKLATTNVKQGDETIFFGFNQSFRPVVAKTTVTDVTSIGIPASASTPRYRAMNFDAVTVDTSLATQCGSGVLMSEDGTVQALWLTYLGERTAHHGKDLEYHLGLLPSMVQPVYDQIASGVRPNLRILNVEMHTIAMSQCRIMGLSGSWIERVEREDPERHQLFMVRKVDSDHNDGLLEGDIILTLNGKLVTRVSDLDVQYDNEHLEAVVVRKRQEIHLKVPTVHTQDLDTDRAIVFCGAVLHRPHHAVRQQISKLHSQVYISSRMSGSPAYMYGLAPTNFITHVNGVATPDLDSFLKETSKIKDNTYFRMKVVTFDNVPWVATLKKNEHYFPTLEFLKDENANDGLGWRKVVHEVDSDGKGREGDENLPSADVADVDGAAGDQNPASSV